MTWTPIWQGITFDQFQAFCKFLNNIADFETAIKLFSFANMDIAKGTTIPFDLRS